MAWVQVNGSRLAYDEAGEGPPVVLVHAGLADRRMWEHQFHALSTHRRVIRYDWRGYGDSADAVGEVAHHEDLLGLMDALGVERAALVGCSFGGAYSIDVALVAPERVSALVLICSGLSGHTWPPEMLTMVRERVHSAVPADRLRRYREGPADHILPADLDAFADAQTRFMVVGPDRDPSDLRPSVWEQALTMSRRVFERTWAGPATHERHPEPPARERLHELHVPTLVINGLADVPYVQAVSDVLAGGIAGARRVDLPHTGHLPPLERPEIVTPLLTEFLTDRDDNTGDPALPDQS